MCCRKRWAWSLWNHGIHIQVKAFFVCLLNTASYPTKPFFSLKHALPPTSIVQGTFGCLLLIQKASIDKHSCKQSWHYLFIPVGWTWIGTVALIKSSNKVNGKIPPSIKAHIRKAVKTSSCQFYLRNYGYKMINSISRMLGDKLFTSTKTVRWPISSSVRAQTIAYFGRLENESGDTPVL